MSDITQIRAKIETADVDGAGTDAWVYLGIAGREFLLNSVDGGDFEAGGTTTPTAASPTSGSRTTSGMTPASPSSTPRTSTTPAYIRFVRSGDAPPWGIERVQIFVHTSDGDRHHFDNLRLDKKKENRRIWLHDLYGERLFLRQV